jgi:hypothetical protein
MLFEVFQVDLILVIVRDDSALNLQGQIMHQIYTATEAFPILVH